MSANYIFEILSFIEIKNKIFQKLIINCLYSGILINLLTTIPFFLNFIYNSKI